MSLPLECGVSWSRFVVPKEGHHLDFTPRKVPLLTGGDSKATARRWRDEVRCPGPSVGRTSRRPASRVTRYGTQFVVRTGRVHWAGRRDRLSPRDPKGRGVYSNVGTGAGESPRRPSLHFPSKSAGTQSGFQGFRLLHLRVSPVPGRTPTCRSFTVFPSSEVPDRFPLRETGPGRRVTEGLAGPCTQTGESTFSDTLTGSSGVWDTAGTTSGCA